MTAAAECKNCGTALSGGYCSNCGQAADVSIPSFGALLADAVGDLLSFDSRIWRSLLTLALKPGRLTLSYLEGQRARHTPPLRMYAATSIAFFLLFALLRATAPSPGSAVDEIGDVSEDVADAARVAAPAPGDEVAAAADDSRVHITVEDGEWSCKLDQDLTPALRERLVQACERIEDDSGASFTRAFADNVPVMMLIFIPIVAAIMRVLYLFARRKYVEHVLFFAHVHTLFFLLAIATLLVWLPVRLAPVPVLAWLAWVLTLAFAGYFAVYVYRAMRYVYAQGHALTAVKYVALGISYIFAFMLTLLGTIVVTAVTA